MKHLPNEVLKFVYNVKGWIVGSTAHPDTDVSQVKDVDILVPFNEWFKASLLIPRDARPNAFGGWKFVLDNTEIDLWPGDLVQYIEVSRSQFLWSPFLQKRLEIRNSNG